MPIELPNGRLLSWQEVSRKIDAELLSVSASSVHEGIWIVLNALKEDYSKAVTFLSDVLYGTVFDIERLHVLVNSRLQVIPSIKEDGCRIAKAAIRSLCFDNTRLVLSIAIKHDLILKTFDVEQLRNPYKPDSPHRTLQGTQATPRTRPSERRQRSRDAEEFPT